MTHSERLNLDEEHEPELIELVAWLEHQRLQSQHGYPKDTPAPPQIDWSNLDFLQLAHATAVDLELSPKIVAELKARCSAQQED